MVQSPERSGKPNLLQEELVGYLLNHQNWRKSWGNLELTKAWKGLAATVTSKAKKPTITKVKGENWQYKGSKVEIHLELS